MPVQYKTHAVPLDVWTNVDHIHHAHVQSTVLHTRGGHNANVQTFLWMPEDPTYNLSSIIAS